MNAAAIRVGESAIAGRGVFATREFAAGEIVEECNVLLVSADHRDHLDKTELFEYYFDWEGDAAVALGLGSLYNHSGEPSARFEKRIAEAMVAIRALRPIIDGEEITVDYGAAVVITPSANGGTPPLE